MATKLYYQGHGSLRMTTADGRVIYIDPYAGDGYDKPADMILVTHQHDDHNQIGLITQKPGCTVISNVEALEGGKHNTFTIGDIGVEAVEAANKNHDPAQCVGYIVSVDGITFYFTGDTSKTKSMESFAAKSLDYVVFPCDGFYNMDMDEAAECAKLIGAKHNIPIHLKPGELFDRERAEGFDAPNRLIIAAGEEIDL
ncbi:MAG: MBL fold metallo-hydrolase [Peptococcaceae bacterium]|jgi:L-ascorbate metabolism protein UlaG (beta-lactamase superfamily)|nr:MBL fold metallo-hydrolase [Peptococcaceae bacterium]